MKTKLLFTTKPHGAQSLSLCDGKQDRAGTGQIGHELFVLKNETGRGQIVLTGEELSDLAKQWTGLVKAFRGRSWDL
jgi:hypothetical protein